MQNKFLVLLIILLSGYTHTVLAAEINVNDADYVWNLTLDNATSVSHLIGEPGVMVVKYADVISYEPLEDATSVSNLVGEPGVMVVKYADTISYKSLDNPVSIGKKELEIDIIYPQHGDLILNSPINVNGTAYSPNEITIVTVNGITASGTTSWSATVPLTTGINTITVEVITNTTYSDTESIKVFHYVEGNYIDTDGDGVIDDWDQENYTESGFWVNSRGIGRMLGDFNNNGMLDSGDVTILMRKIVGLVT
jgi:hypothetical protein